MTTALTEHLDRDTPAAVLSALRESREAARQPEISMMTLALEWAAMHSVDSLDYALTVPGTDRELAIAGDGAPLVAEFAITELATALGRSADSTRIWLGTVLEIRHRLPHTWSRMIDGPLEPYKARQIAASTLSLSIDAAAWVDAQVAPIAHKIGPIRLERITTEAIRRFDPEQAYDNEIVAAEQRHVSIHDRDITAGCASITATVDALDAQDLEAAIARAAHHLLLAGSVESLDVRRALALGEIARRELALDLTTGEITTGVISTGTGRDATLYVHMSATDLALLDDETGLDQPDAHIEHRNSEYTLGIDRLRDWLTRPGTSIAIRPVIDLAADLASSSYQPSATLREQLTLRNHTCVFPHCTRSARTADLDHIDPWEHGGRTASANLAPLCRLHHRVKTHNRWTYTQLSPGEYLWRSPHADVFHVDPTGTTPLPNRPTPRP
jgi:hypothetical protein